MKKNNQQRKVIIISEIYPQHMGDIKELKRMILQSKLGGADIVKLQIYSSKNLWKDTKRLYLDLNKNELFEIKEFCDKFDIELSASVFDKEKLDWCEELNFKTYKIASRTLKENPKLCEEIIKTKKRVIISLGMYDIKKGAPYNKKNIEYMYCVSKYPTALHEIKMPNFKSSFITGYSDHTVGVDACLFAIANGALLIEKHFSNNKSMNVETQLGHLGSMNMYDLEVIRRAADSFTLLLGNKK
jgi:sialic acid synthase SpsE